MDWSIWFGSLNSDRIMRSRIIDSSSCMAVRNKSKMWYFTGLYLGIATKIDMMVRYSELLNSCNEIKVAWTSNFGANELGYEVSNVIVILRLDLFLFC